VEKFFKSFTIVFVVLLLVGCGGNDNTLTCTITEKDDSSETISTITAVFEEDEAKKVTVESDIKTNSESVATFTHAILKPVFEGLAEYDGVEAETKLDKTKIYTKMTVDYSKVSDEFLSDQEGNGTFAKGRTKEEAKKELEKEGYTCK